MQENDKELKRGRGRPPGARNKSKLIKAQLAFDDASALAAETLIAIMQNDKDQLNCSEDVPITIRLNACKVILDKAIANEKDKLENSSNTFSKRADSEDSTVSTTPRVVPIAKHKS